MGALSANVTWQGNRAVFSEFNGNTKQLSLDWGCLSTLELCFAVCWDSWASDFSWLSTNTTEVITFTTVTYFSSSTWGAFHFPSALGHCHLAVTGWQWPMFALQEVLALTKRDNSDNMTYFARWISMDFCNWIPIADCRTATDLVRKRSFWQREDNKQNISEICRVCRVGEEQRSKLYSYYVFMRVYVHIWPVCFLTVLIGRSKPQCNVKSTAQERLESGWWFMTSLIQFLPILKKQYWNL